MKRLGRIGTLLAAWAVVATAGCTAPASIASEGTIGLLLPDAEVARYETSDRPTFEEITRRRCPTCMVLYANAGANAARQQDQAESMLARGAKVLVLDAVDTVAAQSIVDSATRRGAVVVTYDRFIDHSGVAAYVSFDSELIGQQQTRAILDALPNTPQWPSVLAGEGGILLLNGSPTDPNAAALHAGAQRALAGSGVRVLGEFDVPGWSATRAQDWVTGQLTQFRGHVAGIVAGNDALAGGAIASLKAAGAHPVPPVSGQDAELSAIQRIVAGDQLMTVAKATDEQARTAAEIAVRLLRGEVPMAPTTIRGVPSFLLAPTPVYRDDVERVIVRGRVFSVQQICTPAYADACQALDLIDKERR